MAHVLVVATDRGVLARHRRPVGRGRADCLNAGLFVVREVDHERCARILLIPEPLPVHYYKHVLLELVAY